MLDTDFPRPPGDVGHPATWDFPVAFARVPGATARKVVGGDDADLLDAFVAAGEALALQGAVGLITSCGFLAARQTALTARLSLPVATSSLLQIPVIARCLPGRRRVGVVTYDAKALTERHFADVGADPATPKVGLPDGGHWRAMIEGGEAYDADMLEAELVAAVERLLASNGDIAAIVLECTNLPPFAAALRARFGLPIYDVVTMGGWFYQGLIARPFGHRNRDA